MVIRCCIFEHTHIKWNALTHSQKAKFTCCLFASISTLHITVDKSKHQALVYHPLYYGQWLNLQYLISVFPTLNYNESATTRIHHITAAVYQKTNFFINQIQKSMRGSWITKKYGNVQKLGHWVYSLKNSTSKKNGPDQQNIVALRCLYSSSDMQFPSQLQYFDGLLLLPFCFWCFCIFIHYLSYD